MNPVKKSQMKSRGLSFFVYFSILLGLLFSGVSYRYLQDAPKSLSVWGTIYFYVYSFFYYSFLSFALSVPFALLINYFKRTSYVLAFVAQSIFLILFVADSFVYQQFRLHLNIAMLQMTLLGGGEIVSFSWSMIIEILLLIGLCVFAVLSCFTVATRICKTKSLELCKFWLGVLFVGLIITQAVYGCGFAFHNNNIILVSENLPWSRPIHFNKILIKLGIVSREDVYSFKKPDSKGQMNYPLTELNCTGGEPYNIVFLVVDSLRYDMIKSDTMPNIYSFSQDAINFKDHFSGGINTRHGIFTLFTGIPGSYWERSKASKSGSALIKALQQRGYEIGLFTSAPLTMPEFNQTIFASLPNPRIGSKGTNSIEKDENAVKDMEEWLKKLPNKAPFFAFLFLDAVHAAAFPETSQFSVFKPYWKEVNHIKLSNDFDPIPYFNRYKNSVFYTDKNLKSVLDSLKKYVDFEKTIIVISSDHGEEFNDNRKNYWGHNGNFTKYQAQIPLIIKWPGKKSIDIEYRTSSLDVVPTLLTRVLGCKNPIRDYSVGTDLFEPKKERSFVYVSNYSRDAFVEKDKIVLINELGILSVLDPSYNPIKDNAIPKYMKQVLEESSLYLKRK